MSLRGKQLRGLRENQLSCGKNDLNNVFMNIFYPFAAKNIDMCFYYKNYIYKGSHNRLISQVCCNLKKLIDQLV